MKIECFQLLFTIISPSRAIIYVAGPSNGDLKDFYLYQLQLCVRVTIKNRKQWSQEFIQVALDALKNGKSVLRAAQEQTKPGPNPFLLNTEETGCCKGWLW